MNASTSADLAQALIGKMPLVQFNHEVRERRTMLFQSAYSQDILTTLFDLRSFEALLLNEAVPPTYVDVVTGGLPRSLANLQRAHGLSKFDAVADSLHSGATIRISDVQRFDPTVRGLISEVRAFFQARSQVNAYLTPPDKVGFQPHFDTTDVFILQCHGQKEWKIFAEYTNQVALPLVDTAWEPDRYRPSEEFETLSLSAGDVLYLPRGVMHQARCVHEASLHLTVSIWPITLADLIASELKRVVASDIRYRERLALPAEGNEDQLGALAAQVRTALLDLADTMDVETAIAREKESMMGPSSGRIDQASLKGVLAELRPRASIQLDSQLPNSLQHAG